MHYGIKTQQNNGLQALSKRAGANITNAIQNASAKTGVDFSYLMQQANVESSFKANAKAGTSSATGLYQFTERTWLQMVNEHGAEHGLGQYADKISDNGKVSSKAMRQQILALRNDPKLSSAMAAEYAAENKEYLQSTVGGEIGSTELYMAHFMGPGGAAKFLNEMRNNPDANAARKFSREACANENIFYTKSGRAKSLAEIYAHFDKKFGATGSSEVTTQVADNSSVRDMDAASYAQYTKKNYKYQRADSAPKTDIYDEKTGVWLDYTSKRNKAIEAMMPTRDGQITGLQARMSNPVDVMTLVDMQRDISKLGHNDSRRYNA